MKRSLIALLYVCSALLSACSLPGIAANDNSPEPAPMVVIPTLTTVPPTQPVALAPAQASLPPVATQEGAAAQPTTEPVAAPTETSSPTATATPSATATETAEPTPTATFTPNPDAEIEYEVQPGDTIGEIALEFGVPLDELMAYNGISDPLRLRVGTILRIPVGEARVAAMRATGTAVALISPTVVPSESLPNRVVLEVTQMYQRLNNCAPTTSAMVLSYYDLTQTQADMAALQKPVAQDVNVTAEEVAVSMRAIGMRAYVGIDGDIDMVIRLLAAGFPVMSEEWLRYDGGMGHFRAIRGYDREEQQILYNDSFLGPDRWRSYDEFLRDWHPYNNKFVIPYRADQESQLSRIIGENWNQNTMMENLRATSQAQADANPNDPYAWWGLGEALLWQGNATDAITAFERARAVGLPWRYEWYRYGYLEALNEVGRYEDLLAVSLPTLQQMGRSEDIRFHRAVALNALGRPDEAVTELRRALEDHPRFAPAATLLEQLGG